jgi:HEAT repeat protein
MNVTDAVDDLLPLLKDSATQMEVMRNLSTLGSRRAVPALVDLLESSNSRTRYAALQLMLELDGPETVAALRKIAGTNGHPVQEMAISGLATVSAWSAVPDLLLCLQSRSTAVQDAAASALATLGIREAIPPLLALFHEDKSGMRTSLMSALARLGAGEAAPRILGLLRHEDSGVLRCAIQAAGELNLREAVPALLGLSRGDDLFLRGEASSALTRLGDRSEVPTLLAGGQRELFLLNRLRRPELWERLDTSSRTRVHWRSHSQTWSELACDAGLEFSLEIHPDYYWDDRRRGDSSQGGVTTLLELLEESLDYYSLTVILEEDRLRVVPVEAARHFWKEWWRRNPDR